MFAAGDRVEYAAKFLRSIGWVTNVTTGMIVDRVSGRVVYCRTPDGRVVPILDSNLIRKDRLHLEAH